MRVSRSVLTALISAGATFFAAGISALGQRPAAGSAALRREIELTRRSGLPVTPSDMRSARIPPEQNAAPLYREIMNRLASAFPFGGIDAGHSREVNDLLTRPALTPQKVAAARAAFRKHAAILVLIHRAASRPECDFERDWSLGAALTMPEFSSMREEARWIAAESALQLDDHRPLDAVRTQALGFRIARHAESDSLLISCLVGSAINGITLAGMQRILYNAGGEPGVTEAVRSGIIANWRPLNLKHAMRGELVTAMASVPPIRKGGLPALEQFAGETGGADIKRIPRKPKPAYWDGFIDRNQIYLLRAYRKLFAAIDKPWQERRAAFAQVEDDAEAAGKRGDFSAMLAVVILPVNADIAWYPERDRARIEVVRAGAAVLAWKTAHGSLPEWLEEAANPVPLDPFDGKALRYRREGDGFVVHSVGPTVKFDGGTPTMRAKATEPLFRWPKPA